MRGLNDMKMTSLKENEKKTVRLASSECSTEEDVKNEIETNNENQEENLAYVPQIKWLDLAAQIFIHFGCLYGLYLIITQAKIYTSLWGKQNYFTIILVKQGAATPLRTINVDYNTYDELNLNHTN